MPVPRADDKIRENRLRRLAQRQGLILVKCPRREPHSCSSDLYGLAMIGGATGHWSNRLVVSPDAGMTIDGVEEYLTYGMTRTAIMEYLIKSYGPVFVEDLVKHLPPLCTKTSNIAQE
ncbi:MAG: hypothetical protein ACRDS0_08165 [Pseudonocardiaceae bacterium]